MTATPNGMASAEPLAAALRRLARGEPTDLAALLHDVERDAVIDGTKVIAHCHCIRLDGNGRPRIESLVEAVAEHVLDYAIPRSEYRAALEESTRTRSSQKLTRLHIKAQKLFTDLVQSGEGGELLLFTLAEKILRLPQLICKMSLKTSARMHIHGADGLHAGVDKSTGRLLLYWGESKIHGDVSGAIRECLASLAPMLIDHQAAKRDLQLLDRHLDVDDADLENALRGFLDPDSEAFNSLQFCGLCLVGFDCDAYTNGPLESELADIVSEIASMLPAWKGHVAKRVVEEQLKTFSMHFVLVPFPSAEEFRRLFRRQLRLDQDATDDGRESEAAAAAFAPPGQERERAHAKPASRRSRNSKPKGGPRGAP